MLVLDEDLKFAALKVRNSLPVDISQAPSLTTFKNRLKTNLFREAYGQ